MRANGFRLEAGAHVSPRDGVWLLLRRGRASSMLWSKSRVDTHFLTGRNHPQSHVNDKLERWASISSNSPASMTSRKDDVV